MPNEFATTPQLDPDFPKPVKLWHDPVVGIDVPKVYHENLQWRARLLELADEDEEMQTELYTAASQSILFFVNAFCFTKRVFKPGADGKLVQDEDKHLPFVTWPVQDDHLLRLEHCVDNGEDLLTDKSRDMGATWTHIVLYVHRFLFRDSESHLLLSRKEDAVDLLDGIVKNYPHGNVADVGTLFGKIDYVLSYLPEWMLPSMSRKRMHLVNQDNGTRIDGESSNPTAGSSDRRTSIMLDEMAKMKDGEAIKRSTKDVTACRFPCSTPNGAGTAYSKWRMSGQIPVFILPWWEHPEKGAGRYCEQDDLGRWKIRSPWYNREAELRTPKEMAIEIDMDHIGSGDTFFEATIIEEHKTLFAKPPRRTMTIRFKDNVPETQVGPATANSDLKSLVLAPKGPWKVWCNLIKNRPDQNRTYTIGIDISKGMGASNSTMSIMCNETREKIASFACAHTPPYELAKLACAAAVWAGGRKRPLIIWENNGDPGFDFGRQLVRVYGYPNIYFARQAGTVGEKKGKRYGWRSSPENKAVALGMLRRAYAHGTFINHDEAALVEALSYVHFEGGGIGPSELVEESDSTRKAHGDRVIADMLCVVAQGEAPSVVKDKPGIPRRSFGYRLNQYKKRRKTDNKDRQRATRFDFRG